MRYWVAPLSLIVLVPFGLLLTTSGPRSLTSTWLADDFGELLPRGDSPSVQYTARAKDADDDPLISPIILPESTEIRPVSMTLDFTHDKRAIFHPHGEQVCASGCAASRHPTEDLTHERFNSLMLKYTNEPFADAGSAQDALLYYGRQTSQLLAADPNGRLDPVRLAVLKHQLAHDHAEIEIRVVDALGQVRAWLPPTNVPLDRRHEFELDTNRLQPMIASGTVKRVGRDYVWTRL